MTNIAATEINRYAAEIMDMIGQDMIEGTVPDTIKSFTELHNHVDANEYSIQADVPFDIDGENDLLHAVEAEVGRRLAERYDAMLKGEPTTVGAVVVGHLKGDLYSFTRTATGGDRDWEVAGDVGDADYATVLEYTGRNRRTFSPVF